MAEGEMGERQEGGLLNLIKKNKLKNELRKSLNKISENELRRLSEEVTRQANIINERGAASLSDAEKTAAMDVFNSYTDCCGDLDSWQQRALNDLYNHMK